MNGLTSWRGFTLAELLVVLVLSGILLVVLARAADVIGRVEQATRSESDARALEATIDRISPHRGRSRQDGAGPPDGRLLDARSTDTILLSSLCKQVRRKSITRRREGTDEPRRSLVLPPRFSVSLRVSA
jgi:prepilin-type N-terminal cleavage/methylation domain-containing protein